MEKKREESLVMARFFEKPKCKPWDMVKGRRLACCHGLGEHTHWCMVWIRGMVLSIPRIREISVGDLYGQE